MNRSQLLGGWALHVALPPESWLAVVGRSLPHFRSWRDFGCGCARIERRSTGHVPADIKVAGAGFRAVAVQEPLFSFFK